MANRGIEEKFLNHCVPIDGMEIAITVIRLFVILCLRMNILELDN